MTVFPNQPRHRAAPSGREHHTVTAPRRGPSRERARRTILTLLRRAHTQQHRVAFTVTFTDGTRLRLGGKAGYDPDRALIQCRIEADDPFAWLKDQLAGRHPPRGAPSSSASTSTPGPARHRRSQTPPGSSADRVRHLPASPGRR